MKTYNINLEDCEKNQFPIDLIFIGNQILKGVLQLARTTAGLIILLPIGVASLIIIPITYILIGIIFSFYIFRITKLTNRVLKIQGDRDNYSNLYSLFLQSNKADMSLRLIESKGGEGIKGFFLKPIVFFIKKMHFQVCKVNKHLESQLFESLNPDKVSKEDVEFFKSQRRISDDDWDDDELWEDFQTKHHHLTN